MNRRRLEHLTKALDWWAAWVRAGRTWPNTLGFPGATVEYRMMRGETAGAPQRGSKTPLRFTLDSEVEDIDRALQRMPEGLRAVVCARHMRGMSLRDGANAVGITVNEFRAQHRMALAWLDGRLGD